MEIQGVVEELQRIVTNLRKDGPNRKRDKSAVIRKIQEVENIYCRFAEVEKFICKNGTHIEIQELQFWREKFGPLYREAKERILASEKVETQIEKSEENTGIVAKESTSRENGQKQDLKLTVDQSVKSVELGKEKVTQTQQNSATNLKSSVENNSDIRLSKMDFDFNTAQKLPTFSAADDEKRKSELRDFLNNIEFYYGMLTNAGKVLLLDFILKCKVQGKAKTELGTCSASTFEDFKKKILEKCGPKETVESLQAKIANLRQGRRPMRDFVNEFEHLVSRMTELEISSQGENTRGVLEKANETRGLAFLKKGVNERARMILESARHKSLPDAISHLLEIDAATDPPADKIFNVNNGRVRPQGQNFSRNYDRNWNNRWDNGNRGSYNNRTQRPNYNSNGNFRQNLNGRKFQQQRNTNQSSNNDARTANSSSQNSQNFRSNNNSFSRNRGNYRNASGNNRNYGRGNRVFMMGDSEKGETPEREASRSTTPQ